MLIFIILGLLYISSALAVDHPTLPAQWKAETIEPGAPGTGKGIESYNFVSNPSNDQPSSMWSNYTGCSRLIHATGSTGKRYLLGCDAMNCCYEEQDGNQVEFQIPNFRYTNPSKTVDISHQRANITSFGNLVEADEWSWEYAPHGITIGEYKVYTNHCEDCVNDIELVLWQTRAFGSEWFSIQFKNYRGLDPESQEGKDFAASFNIPAVCQGNILQCPSSISKVPTLQRSGGGKCCDTCPDGTQKYYSIPKSNPLNCGESCIAPEDFKKFHLFEPQLTLADSSHPCEERGFKLFLESETHGVWPINIKVDMYTNKENE